MRFDPQRYASPGEVQSARVRRIFDYWRSKAIGGQIPRRTAIDPVELGDVLSCLLIVEIVNDRFRYRLVGTKVVSNLGVDFTGRYLDELLGPSHTIPWVGFYRQSFAERRPVMGKVTDPTESGDTFDYEFGLFPMSHGGTAIRQFIAIEDYFDFNLKSGALVGLL